MKSGKRGFTQMVVESGPNVLGGFKQLDVDDTGGFL